MSTEDQDTTQPVATVVASTTSTTTSPSASPRQPSEAFPLIPKGIHNRKSDAKHRPFRPSPLSGNKPTSPPSSSSSGGRNTNSNNTFFVENTVDDNSAGVVESASTPTEGNTYSQYDTEETKMSSTDEENVTAKPPTSSLIKLSSTSGNESSSSADESKRQLQQQKKNDEISKLSSRLDSRLDELSALERRLLDTENNVKRLIGVLRGQFMEKFPKMIEEMEDNRQKLYAIMNVMDQIAATTIEKRDIVIEEQTTLTVRRSVEKAEELLGLIEQAIHDQQVSRSKSKARMIRSLIVTFILVLIVMLLVLILFVVFTDENEEDSVRWLAG
jgi:hypothetical protein